MCRLRSSPERFPARVALLVLVTLVAAAAAARAVAAAVEPVVLDYYREPGCPICRRIDIEVLPRLEASLGGLYTLNAIDTSVETNYVRLARLIERLEIDENASAVIVLDNREAFAGWEAISGSLPPRVEEEVLARLDQATQPAAAAPPPRPAPTADAVEDDDAFLRARVRRFTPYAVALAGLLDGINPCAVATLVFLVSMLGVARLPVRRMALTGAAFCAASFITYTALGFGLLHGLYAFSGFHLVRQAVEWLFVLALLALALISLLDARRFAVTQRADAVVLQLPHRLKLVTRRFIRNGIRSRRLLPAAFGAGAAVTALESVCTGQVYVPTLVLVVKSGAGDTPALALLLLYNAMFVLPLIAALALACLGLELDRFLDWSRRNVVLSKVLLAVFFFSMAALLLAL